MKKRETIFLSPPCMHASERRMVKEAFDSNYITAGGPMVARFEREMEARTGIPHAAAVSAGTAALSLAYRELGVGRGDIVFCSDLTFIASIGPAIHAGAKPVFIDSNPATWCIDPALLEEALFDAQKRGKIPKCVTVVDLYGQCCDYDAIEAICARYGVPLLVDAAEAFGATYKTRSAGDAGFAGVLSFNGNKIMTTSGGGMLLSRDAAVIERARKRSQQSREEKPWYEHVEIGHNYRLGNVNAAIGLGQLAHFDAMLEKKRRIFARYDRELAGLMQEMPEASYGRCSRWLSVFLLDDGGRVMPLIDSLAKEAIEARPVWKPMHLQPCFKGCKCYGGAVSERLFAHGICLPSGAGLTAPQQSRVIRSVKRILHEQ